MQQILVVEDESVIRTALRRLLERNGYQVSEAGSVLEAETNHNLDEFDLVISDLRLPGAPGTDLIKKAGPGQHFLGFKETLSGVRQGEIFFPEFGYRNTYDKYFNEGHNEIEKARAEVERLLALPDEDPLPPEVDRELQRILNVADKACAESVV